MHLLLWGTPDAAATPNCPFHRDNPTNPYWHPKHAQKGTTLWRTPSKRTRSQCPDHKALHQTPVIPTMQHLPLSAPADHPILTCNLHSFPPQQKRKSLQLNTKLECPGPCTRPVDPASMAYAIRKYEKNKARALSASDAFSSIYFYDLYVISHR